MHHVPTATPRGSGQPLARYFGKYFGKYFCVLSYKKYFVIRTFSCIRQFRLVGCVRAKINSLTMFSASPRTEASGKRAGHPSNRASPVSHTQRWPCTRQRARGTSCGQVRPARHRRPVRQTRKCGSAPHCSTSASRGFPAGLFGSICSKKSTDTI